MRMKSVGVGSWVDAPELIVELESRASSGWDRVQTNVLARQNGTDQVCEVQWWRYKSKVRHGPGRRRRVVQWTI